MALSDYQSQTQRLLHDPSARFYSLADLTVYINIARRQVAAKGQCVRVLLSGGTILSIAITAPGAGYVSPVVTITGAGQQAFATATQLAGAVQTPVLRRRGWGYTTAPTIAITDATGPGAGATATATIDNSVSTVAGQENYLFSEFNPLAVTTPGVQSVLGLVSVACSQGGTFKPMLTYKVFSEFQAYLRLYQNQAQNYPVYWSQYGAGINAQLYLFPWPSQVLSMDVDAYCLPIDLVTDSTPEAIPSPWGDAVPYYAAYLAYDNSQRKDDSARMLAAYNSHMQLARSNSEGPIFKDPYTEDYA